MPSSTPSPDRFQQEIDDIVRLAEKRLEHKSVGYRARKSTRALRGRLPKVNFNLPPAEMLAGWALALLLVGWLGGLLPFLRPIAFLAQVVGIFLLVVAIVMSITGRSSGRLGGSEKMWRGERVSYGSPYGNDLLARLRRFFRRR